MNLPPFLNSDQALYSVVPLSLDLNYLANYFPHFKNSLGDCLIFTAQEMPQEFFKFASRKYSLLSLSNSKSNQTINNEWLPVPFTTLLVGPISSCRLVIEKFDVWGQLDTKSIILKKDSKEIKLKKPTRKKNTSKRRITRCWLPILHPTVWAHASFSNVVVCTSYPQMLQDELQRIFNFPITVTAISPQIHNEHNEFVAWLSSIYALFASRNLYRTVFCHSYTWTNQMQFHTDVYNRKALELPQSWQPLVSVPNILIQEQNLAQEESMKVAKKISEFDIKLLTYKSSHSLMGRSVGLGVAKLPVMKRQVYNSILNKGKLKLKLSSNANFTVLSVPFNPSEKVKYTIKKIIEQSLGIDQEKIIVEVEDRSAGFVEPQSLHYTILTNLTLKLCKNIDNKTKNFQKSISFSQCKYILNHLTSCCTVLECSVNRYDREVAFSKAFVVIDCGYFGDTEKEFGFIEDIFYKRIYYLCGTNRIIDKDFNLQIKFINNDRKDFTATYADIVFHSVSHAILNTIHKKQGSAFFPTRWMQDEFN